MKVHCSKGTYIRTLCHDIGQKLGCGACMEKLTRTKVSRFEIKDSLTLAQIEILKKEDRLSEILVPIDQMFADYPRIIVSEKRRDLRIMVMGSKTEMSGKMKIFWTKRMSGYMMM